MNERIQELAKQIYGTEATDQEIKFAELIVKECVNVVDDMADPEDSERYFWAIRNVSQKIKDHFGVKE